MRPCREVGHVAECCTAKQDIFGLDRRMQILPITSVITAQQYFSGRELPKEPIVISWLRQK
jgi:hypothetical protein